MNYRNLRTASVFAMIVLGGCGQQKDAEVALGGEAESVRLVLYYTDGESDGKTVGDWALINTGEALQVQRARLKPDEALVTRDWNGRYLAAREGVPQQGTVTLKLNRRHGIACIDDRCGKLLSICPPVAEFRIGKRCASYAINKE